MVLRRVGEKDLRGIVGACVYFDGERGQNVVSVLFESGEEAEYEVTSDCYLVDDEGKVVKKISKI